MQQRGTGGMGKRSDLTTEKIPGLLRHATAFSKRLRGRGGGSNKGLSALWGTNVLNTHTHTHKNEHSALRGPGRGGG